MGVCTWAEENDHLVRPAFGKALQNRIKGTMYDVRKRKKTPKWLNDIQFADVQKNKKDSKFIKRSKTGKNNKLCAVDSDGKLKATHHFGSISSVDYIEKVSSENQGKVLSAPELFYDMHTKVNSDEAKEFSNLMDKEIYEEYLETKSNMVALGETTNDNKLFYDIVGGHKKGVVYGLGIASS